MKPFGLASIVALLVIIAAPAFAQPEVGVSVGTAGFLSTSGESGDSTFMSLHVGRRVGSRFHLETVVDMMSGCPHVCVAYDVQVKLDLAQSNRTSLFATMGAAGAVTHTEPRDFRYTYDNREYVNHVPGRTEFIPPWLPVGGIGVEQQLSDHLTLRVDAQTYVFLVVPVAARVSVGLSVPFGSR